MFTGKSIDERGLGETLADVFHEFSILLRYARFRIAERLRSPLWRFIGGQRPVDYEEEDLLETAAPEQMQKPEDVIIPMPQNKPNTPVEKKPSQDSQKLLDLFGQKFADRENRKRQAASRASKGTKGTDGRQMEFDFSENEEIAEEPLSPEDLAYSIPEGEYMLPPFTLFENNNEDGTLDTEEIDATRKAIQDCLDNFSFDA
ncbi:MAG: hypothetical protein IJS15_13640, partial [Victivallales bacterium]|nr:hypothetical protein [Victivallales bacterium]